MPTEVRRGCWMPSNGVTSGCEPPRKCWESDWVLCKNTRDLNRWSISPVLLSTKLYKKDNPPKKGKVRVTADTCSIFVFILLMNGHFWFGKALSIVVQVSLLMVLCHALNSSLEGQKVLILLKPHLQLISLWLIDLCPNYIWFCPFQHHKHTPLFFFILHLGCRFPSLVSSQSLPDTPPQSCSLPLSSVSI